MPEGHKTQAVILLNNSLLTLVLLLIVIMISKTSKRQTPFFVQRNSFATAMLPLPYTTASIRRSADGKRISININLLDKHLTTPLGIE
jgi:hypothetical protein